MKCTSKLNRPTFDSRHNIEIRIKPISELAQFHIKDIEMSSNAMYYSRRRLGMSSWRHFSACLSEVIIPSWILSVEIRLGCGISSGNCIIVLLICSTVVAKWSLSEFQIAIPVQQRVEVEIISSNVWYVNYGDNFTTLCCYTTFKRHEEQHQQHRKNRNICDAL